MEGSFLTRRDDEAKARGKEIFEIKPVILGGSPTDLDNKTLLSRDEHIEAVRYWNDFIREFRRASNRVHGDTHARLSVVQSWRSVCDACVSLGQRRSGEGRRVTR
jgi:hypothetical protein